MANGICLGNVWFLPEVAGKQLRPKTNIQYSAETKTTWSNEISRITGPYGTGTPYDGDTLTAIKWFAYNGKLFLLCSAPWNSTARWVLTPDNINWQTGGVLRRLYTGLKHLLAPRKVVLV